MSEVDERYFRIVEELRRWAQAKLNCSHTMCSIHESAYERLYGRQILDIIEKTE